jgi:DNA-binding beta-propeller fold protein YncE
VTAGDDLTAIAVSPGGDSAYVANGGGDDLSQYTIGVDGNLTPKTPATVPAGNSPSGIAIADDGASAYVPSESTDSVLQFTIGVGGRLTPKAPAAVPAGDGPVSVVPVHDWLHRRAGTEDPGDGPDWW